MTLRARSLTKSFGRTRALRHVDLDVEPGSIHALVGGNGSGKSTLIKILAGVYTADGGSLVIGGRPVELAHHDPAGAAALGLRFVHQNLGVFASLSVTENLALGSRYLTTRPGRIDWRAEHRRAADLIERFGIHAGPDTPMAALRPADHAMVAIARALQDLESATSGILVLDEPTASLPRHEVEIVLDAARRYAAAGQTIIFVGHRLDEVLDIADHVTVFRDGESVARRPTAGLRSGDLVREMLGRDLEHAAPAEREPPTGTPLLSVRSLVAGSLTGVDLDVWPGEVVGVAGLLGSGRTSLLHALFGSRPDASGSMVLGDSSGLPPSVKAAMEAGIALVPEGRVDEAIFADHSVRHNLSASVVATYWRRWRLSHGRERTDATSLVESFGIRPASEAATMGNLSGGNQQKAVLARWLRRRPRLLLLDEPTQGVDVGARASIHQHVRAAVGDGAAALYVSSDFEELALVCDRVVVLAGGRVAHELHAPSITADAITARCHADQHSGEQPGDRSDEVLA